MISEITKLKAASRPWLRGHFHQAGFFFALGASTMLLARCGSIGAFVSVLIYTLSLCGLLGVSALYHRVVWEDKPRSVMRKLDHAFIFILIAGTGTPLGYLTLPEGGALRFLFLIWSAAGLGVMQSLFWGKAPKWIAAGLYVLAGWMAAPYLPEFGRVLGSGKVTLILLGGVFYTVGAVVYAIRKPNPSPKNFGYHEIFHALVIVAAAFHFIVIDSLVK